VPGKLNPVVIEAVKLDGIDIFGSTANSIDDI